MDGKLIEADAGLNEEDRALDGAAGGVQAVETGIRLLAALIELGPASKLKTLAEQSGMSPPKAHRYLTSYCRSGLVERHGKSGGYRFGPLALQLGLAALRHLDVVGVATPALAELRDETGFTAALSVWGSFGPTFVRLEESNAMVVVTTRVGTIVPVLSSSTGKIFGAFLPRANTAALIAAELKGEARTAMNTAAASSRLPARTARDVELMFEQVRQQGLAFNESGELTRGINAIAAPLFNHEGQLVAAMTLWGEAGILDTGIDGAVARALKEKTRQLSRQMGAA